jgi:hypothetical protein
LRDRSHRRRHASREDAQRAKREASRAWWTPERKTAHAERIRELHAEGHYGRTGWARRRVRVWTDEERAAQGERTRALWASGRMAAILNVLRARALANWDRGVYDGLSALKREQWKAGKFDGNSAQTRALWRDNHTFGMGRNGLRRWHGGLRGELLKKFPEHEAWIRALSDADLDGLLSTNQEKDGDGEALGGVLRNLFGEGRDRAAS